MSFNKKNLTLISFITIVLILSFFSTGIFYLTKSYQSINLINVNSKNVILFIGDGMGQNHVNLTNSYNETQMHMTSNATTINYVTTNPINNSVTDSAAAATALSTATKTTNGSVAKFNGNNLENMAEFAKKHNKGIGIITTDNLTGATPACFSSHSKSRNNVDEIFNGQLKSEVDIFISSGKEYCDKKVAEINNFNYNYVTDYDSLTEAVKNFNSKIMASFNSIPPVNNDNNNPNLAQVSMIAIEYLSSKFDNGFFLMIEEAHIDKSSHANEVFDMMEHVNNLDNTLKVVNNWAQHNDTFVLLTADHETGNLQLNKNISNDLFLSTGHTGKNVYLFCYSSKAKDIFKNNSVIDNTDVSIVCRKLLEK